MKADGQIDRECRLSDCIAMASPTTSYAPTGEQLIRFGGSAATSEGTVAYAFIEPQKRCPMDDFVRITCPNCQSPVSDDTWVCPYCHSTAMVRSSWEPSIAISLIVAAVIIGPPVCDLLFGTQFVALMHSAFGE